MGASEEVAIDAVLAEANARGIRSNLDGGHPGGASTRVARVVAWGGASDDVAAGDLVVPAWTRRLDRGTRARAELLAALAAADGACLVVPDNAAPTPHDGAFVTVSVPSPVSWPALAAELQRCHAAVLARREERRSAVAGAALAGLERSSAPDHLLRVVGEAARSPLLLIAGDGSVLASHEGPIAIEHVAAAGRLLADGRVAVATGDAGPVVVPVTREGHRVATLLGFPSTGVDDCDLALRSVASLLALSIRLSDAPGTDRHVAREIVLAMIGSDLGALEQAARRAGRLGVLHHPPYRVLDIRPIEQRLGRAGPQRLAARLEPEVHLHDPDGVVVVHEGAVVVVVGARVDEANLTRSLCRRTPVPLSVGTGDVATELRRLPSAFRQARRAAQLGARTSRPGRLTRFAELGALRMLCLVPEHEGAAFVTDVLGSLAGTDQDASELRRTARILLEENMNVARSARRLFVHYNTLRHRIERLEDVLGPFTTDPQARLAVDVALTMHRIAEPNLAGS